MNRTLIPSILAFTILMAGIYALMPLDQVSTVHNTIQANTMQFSVVAVDSTSDNTAADFRITCGAGSAGCRILDVYLDDDDTGGETVDAGAISLVMNGETVVLATDAANTVLADLVTVALTGPGGVSMTASDTILVVVDGTSDLYSITVISESEGDTDITVVEE